MCVFCVQTILVSGFSGIAQWVISENPEYIEYTEYTYFWYLVLAQKSSFFTKHYSANGWLISLITFTGSLQIRSAKKVIVKQIIFLKTILYY